jgi:hypothetical protein
MGRDHEQHLDGRHATLRPRYGKYPAVVVRNDVEDSGHTGRIEVRIPGILEEDEAGEPRPIEVIARPCLPPGFFFVPDEGSHVWVEFAAGDVNSPIWVGVWYPEGEPPQTSEGQAPDFKQKVIRTPAGHVVTLGDDAGSIVIKDKHGNVITLDADGATLTHKDESTTIALRSNSVVLAGNADADFLLMKETTFRQFVLSHQHSGGNMGALTGPPTPPVPDYDTWFTTKTKAE